MRAPTRSIMPLALLAALALAACGKEAPPRAEQAAASATATRIAACDRFLDRYARCEKLSRRQRGDFEGALAQWQLMLKSGDAAVARSVQQACEKASPGWERSLTALGC